VDKWEGRLSRATDMSRKRPHDSEGSGEEEEAETESVVLFHGAKAVIIEGTATEEEEEEEEEEDAEEAAAIARGRKATTAERLRLLFSKPRTPSARSRVAPSPDARDLRPTHVLDARRADCSLDAAAAAAVATDCAGGGAAFVGSPDADDAASTVTEAQTPDVPAPSPHSPTAAELPIARHRHKVPRLEAEAAAAVVIATSDSPNALAPARATAAAAVPAGALPPGPGVARDNGGVTGGPVTTGLLAALRLLPPDMAAAAATAGSCRDPSAVAADGVPAEHPMPAVTDAQVVAAWAAAVGESAPQDGVSGSDRGGFARTVKLLFPGRPNEELAPLANNQRLMGLGARFLFPAAFAALSDTRTDVALLLAVMQLLGHYSDTVVVGRYTPLPPPNTTAFSFSLTSISPPRPNSQHTCHLLAPLGCPQNAGPGMQ